MFIPLKGCLLVLIILRCVLSGRDVMVSWLLVLHAPVIQGVAGFEEMMTNTCSVYGSRSGPHHSAKYEAKHFLLYASVYGDPELDLGKHRVDLTRLLPLTLEELEDKKSSGKWTTTYWLS
nr:protein plastid movement impaired 1-related 1 [Tanacetum cinerariifolium]